MEENKNKKKEIVIEPAEPEIAELKNESTVLKEEAVEKVHILEEERSIPMSEQVAQVQILNEIKTLIENRLSYDTGKEKAIDKLNDELRLYRDNFITQSQKPILVELIMMYDSLVNILNDLNTHQELTKEYFLKVKNNIENLKEELLEILYRRDVTPFDEHAEVLDYKRHKTIKTIPTSDESENNKVDKIVKNGFLWNDKIIRPEEVIIKKFTKS